MEWLKAFLMKYGMAGLVGVIALILVAQNAGLLPAAHEVVAGNAKADSAATASASQMDTHIQQAKEQTKELKEIKQQLKDNHDTQAIGARLMCLRLSKTDAQRDECAKIN